jgi:hypothetical protein
LSDFKIVGDERKSGNKLTQIGHFYIAAYVRDIILCLPPFPLNDRFGRLMPEHTVTLKYFEIS